MIWHTISSALQKYFLQSIKVLFSLTHFYWLGFLYWKNKIKHPPLWMETECQSYLTFTLTFQLLKSSLRLESIVLFYFQLTQYLKKHCRIVLAFVSLQVLGRKIRCTFMRVIKDSLSLTLLSFSDPFSCMKREICACTIDLNSSYYILTSPSLDYC